MSNKKECVDGEHCPPDPHVTGELCQARMEGMKETVNSVKKQIWASAATVGFMIVLFELVLKFIGR